MNAKDKAIELVNKYRNISLLLDYGGMDFEIAKQCALIACDEVRNHIIMSTPIDDPYANLFALEYWESVKNEIEKL